MAFKNKKTKKEYDRTYYLKNQAKIKMLTKRYKEKNKEYWKKYGKEYYKNNKKKLSKNQKEYQNRLKRLGKYKQKRRDYMGKYRKNISGEMKRRIKVRNLTNRNIKIPFGQLCEICNINQAKEKHHFYYSKPLKVIFACKECHRGVN